eukprot:8979058-Karenia_brevis.AAC.1
MQQCRQPCPPQFGQKALLVYQLVVHCAGTDPIRAETPQTAAPCIASEGQAQMPKHEHNIEVPVVRTNVKSACQSDEVRHADGLFAAPVQKSHPS